MPLTSLDRREEMLDFMFACHEVVEMIMACFARGLGLKEDFFKDVKCLHNCSHISCPSTCLSVPVCLPKAQGEFLYRHHMLTSMSTNHVHVTVCLCLCACLHVHICLSANTS